MARGAYNVAYLSTVRRGYLDPGDGDDSPALPTVTVEATDATATEGGGTGTFTFTRDGSTTGALTVNFTVTGTATSGTDYTSIGTSVEIADGEATAEITVTALDDAVIDDAETVIVTLDEDAAYTVGSPDDATVTIADATTPLTIASANAQTIELWLKSDAGVTTSGGTVTEWLDQSGNDRHGTEATNLPVHSATSFLGGPGITFDATALLTLASACPNQPYTAWLVVASNNTGNRLLLRSTASAHGIGHTSAEKPRLSDGATLDHSTGHSPADPVFSRYAWTSSGTKRVAGSGLSEETAAASTLQPTFDVVGTASAGWIGVVAEIIVISGNHAAGSDVVTQMEAYIAARYPTL
jgi:hypothetical protein